MTIRLHERRHRLRWRVELGSPACFVGAGRHKGFKNQHGSHLINDVLAADSVSIRCAGVPHGIQMAMRLRRREALIPEVHGQRKLCTDRVCEGLCAGGLRALIAGHIERIADDNLRNTVTAQYAADGFQIVPQLTPVERHQRLRGQPELIRKGKADTAVANVKGKDAGDRHCCQGTRTWTLPAHRVIAGSQGTRRPAPRVR